MNKKIVIVTGGTGMLGERYCEALREEYTPIALDIDLDKIEQFNDRGIPAYFCNITNEAILLDTLEDIKMTFGDRIYGLINNAAIDPKFDNKVGEVPKARLEVYPRTQWDYEISVGLTGAFLCTQIFGKEMLEHKEGSIINISSLLGVIAPNQNLYKDPNLPEDQQNVKPVTYSVIKHAIIGLTRYTATYWADKGIRCNALAPNGIYNDHPKEFVDKLTKYIPVGRMADKDEYNGAIRFLLSDESKFMTGQTLIMDGGHSVW